MLEEDRERSGGKEGRTEIDTSAPFESVKEAVSRFGGFGFWKPSDHHNKFSSGSENTEDVDMEKLGEQTARLEKDLILKERETLDVLTDLELTKLLIDQLKYKLQKVEEAAMDESDKENQFSIPNTTMTTVAAAPTLILMDLKQAKMNLSKTTAHLTAIRSSVESFNKKLDKERVSLEKTRERLTHNSSKMSWLEEELTQTRLKLKLVKDMENKDGTNRELHHLSSEIEQFKKVGQAVHLEAQRALTEIEQTKNQIIIAEIHLVAAKKMKEAAQATEAFALEQMKVLSSEKYHYSEAVTLTYEEYASLLSNAQKSEEESNKRVVGALLKVDEAKMCKMEILKKVDEATEEVKTSKAVLDEALHRVEAANRGKLEVEEVLRKWRSDHGRKRRTLATKFKNSSYPSSSAHFWRDSHLVDKNGTPPLPPPVLKQTLSIGQILSQKLMLAERFESGEQLVAKEPLKRNKVSLGKMLSSNNLQNNEDSGGNHHQKPVKRNKVSLGKMLGSSNLQNNEDSGSNHHHQKQFSSSKKNKLGFARFSLLLAKKTKKKRKPLCDLR